jgi:hypothetical protein
MPSDLTLHLTRRHLPARATARTSVILLVIGLLLAVVATPHFVAAASPDEAVVTFATELVRLRSPEHLFRPQPHRLIQQSGFSRAGSNPDRLDFLYKEDDWLVYADQPGPGIVSRIWATHGGTWQDIRIEVDGRVLYEGRADGFFGMDRPPFIAPLCEIRSTEATQKTAEHEAGQRHVWGISYVPIPFQQRFRLLQKKQVYTNVDCKLLPAGSRVAPFPHELSDADRQELSRATEAWRALTLGAPASGAKLAEREFTLPLSGDAEISAAALVLPGPGIIDELRVLADGDDNGLAVLDLIIHWEDERAPAIRVPLDTGLGSLRYRTAALGRAADGWQFLRLPMPFARAATIRFASRDHATRTVRLQVRHRPQALPADYLILRAETRDGCFLADFDHYAHPDVPTKEFFYHNGHTALDHRGRGHVVAYLDRFQGQPELDEHVFVDDERSFPENAWNGTGHEDLFDMAWGHKAHSAPMTSGGSQTFGEVNVKLFWNDPLTFRTAIRFNWEWSYKRDVPPPRDARFRSVIYFYTQPATPAP